MTKHIVNTEAPVRLDRYLRRIIPRLSQGVIEQALRKGKIKLNGKKALSSVRVSEGEEIFILLELEQSEDSSSREFPQSVVKLASRLVREYLLFENEYFMVINKPAKLATQGGSKINLSIDDALVYLNATNKTALKLVHRLDKETSGIVIIAKGYLAATKLAAGFKDRLLKKIYLAVVIGCLPKNTGEISGLIAKNREGTYDKVQEDKIKGKLATTNYKLIQKFGDMSLVEFTPITGRTHQLRVHAQMLGCPIAGDGKYGNMNSGAQVDNMLLHAEHMTIPKEIFGKEYVFQAPLPEYFKKFIDKKV